MSSHGTTWVRAQALVVAASVVGALGCEERSAPPRTMDAPRRIPGRLVVLDAAGGIDVVDLVSGETLEVEGADALEARSLVPGGHGAIVYLVGDGFVRAMAPGTPTDPDRAVGVVRAPRLLPFEVRGSGVARVLVNGGVATAFFEGDGAVRWWDDEAAGALAAPDGRAPTVRERPGVGTQPGGLAIAYGSDLLVSRPAAEGAPPTLDLWPREPSDDGNDAPRARFEGCSGPDAAAEAPGDVLGVACRDVVYVIRPGDGDDPVGTPLSVPIFDGESRVARLRADPAGMPLVGTYGDSVLLRVEPDRVVRVDLSLDIVDLDFIAARRLAVLLGDGSLIEADPIEGQTGRGARVAPAPDDGGILPLAMGVGARAIYVAHAATGRVAEVDLRDWSLNRWLDAGPAPRAIVPFPTMVPTSP